MILGLGDLGLTLIFLAYQRPACHPRDVLELVANKDKTFNPLLESFQCQKECEQVRVYFTFTMEANTVKVRN